MPDCEAWFAEHHADHRGFWLKIGKVGAAQTVTYAEALDVALCHGWIDGQKRGYDETYWLHRFTPRGPRSKWSQINRDKAEALIKAGRMRRAGQARWTRRRPTAGGRRRTPARRARPSPTTWPPRSRPTRRPRRSSRRSSGANRYAILYRVHDAKRPGTRAARIATFVEMCHNHETLH